MRQFHQIGAELLGANEPAADVEMIALAAHILKALGLDKDVTLELNSLGDVASRASYREALVNYFSQHEAKLSEDSKTRLHKNPLRILDSKDEGDRALVVNAPTLKTYFNDASATHFAKLQEGLSSLGITYKLNEKLVRGLDYYSHTVFEFTTDKLGAQGTVLAGGRYDGLVKLMGGNDIAGIGFAAGVERLVALRGGESERVAPQMVVIPLQESVESEAWKLASQLRYEGLRVDIAYKGNAKKRFERADKSGAAIALILGETEVNAGQINLKDLKTGAQETIARAELTATLKRMLDNA
jgi:histidyl-tRNA synthetase